MEYLSGKVKSKTNKSCGFWWKATPKQKNGQQKRPKAQGAGCFQGSKEDTVAGATTEQATGQSDRVTRGATEGCDQSVTLAVGGAQTLQGQ